MTEPTFTQSAEALDALTRGHRRVQWLTLLLALLALVSGVLTYFVVDEFTSRTDRNRALTRVASDQAFAAIAKADRNGEQIRRTNERQVGFTRYLQGRRGIPGVPGRGGVLGAPGPVGAPGPTGPLGRGIAGTPGPFGPVGPVGPQGLAGNTGQLGQKGDTGQVGQTGATGAQGDKGDKGDTGPEGSQGPQGETGPEPDLSGRTLTCEPKPGDPGKLTCTFD